MYRLYDTFLEAQDVFGFSFNMTQLEYMMSHVTPGMNHIGIRKIQKLCRYETRQMRMTKELISVRYTNKMYLFFDNPSYKNYMDKCV